MKAEEIRKLTADEIQAKLADTREELMKLRFQQVTGQLTDPSRLRLLRRDIARLETISREPAAAVEEKKEEPAEEPKAKARPRTRAKAEADEPKPKAKPRAKAKAKAETEKEGEA
ncbi:MAG: large subunit ribosomal protein L29 [Anaerolineaceae bacterium]|nr:MAG: large subunit ribosomal protein L29 [Anaerolineaceae bacterium]